MAGLTLTGFTIRNPANQIAGTVTGLSLNLMTVAAFVTSATNTQQFYEAFIALFDDNTTVTGSANGDVIEPGAGSDNVTSGAGDDIV